MKYTVLVVDDDASVLASLAGVLHSEGYAVVHAANGEEAIEGFKGAGIDLVLLDLKMPKKRGWAAFEEITAIEPFVPVVVLSASPCPCPLASGTKASALIEKPVDIPTLLATIKALVGKSTGARKLKLRAASSGVSRRVAARDGALHASPGEPTARFFSNGFLKRTQHAPIESAESRLQMLRTVWNRCGQLEQRSFMEEIEAHRCARDFFL